MDKQIKNQKSSNFTGGGVNFYKEKIVEIVNQIESESTLKKIYTFAKTLKDILNEKEGG